MVARRFEYPRPMIRKLAAPFLCGILALGRGRLSRGWFPCRAFRGGLCRARCRVPVRIQPAIERREIRVLLPHRGYIDVIPGLLEPSIHRGHLAAGLRLELVPRNLPVLDIAPGSAAEAFGELGHR